MNWERDTSQPKYGINYGIEYAHTLGVAEIYDYEWYYGGFFRTVRDEEAARMLDVEIGKKVVYFPRRTFSMWNARYFILPMFPNGWRDEFRGFATFLQAAERIYPEPEDVPRSRWPEGRPAIGSSITISRSCATCKNIPRAWVVHEARTLARITGLLTRIIGLSPDDDRQDGDAGNRLLG